MNQVAFSLFLCSLSPPPSSPSMSKLATVRRPTQTIIATAKEQGRCYSSSYYPILPVYGVTTPSPSTSPSLENVPFRFETGFALRSKRPPRPLPPPFLSPPSSSFSEPLTTNSQSTDRRLYVKRELVRGLNNGDDAVLAAQNFIGVNDGVGAWATRPRGHAA